MTHRSLWRRSAVLFIVLLLTFALPTIAFAHPLGNFTINQFVGLDVRRDGINLEYIVDMAEIPAFQEIAAFDANENGQADSAEAAAYHADKCASLRADLALALDGQAVDLALASSAIGFPMGAGGLPTLRLTCEFRAVLDSVPEAAHLSFQNRAYPERLGWREIVVTAQDVSLDGDFATASISSRLTNYPQDLLSNPLDQREIEFGVASLSASIPASGSVTTGPISSPLSNRDDKFTRLILLDEISLPTLLFALVISFVWGAMHAMTPGHGKTIVGAYLVGSRGTPKHALYLGLTTTITHTLGVFVFGLITLFAARFIVPEKLYPWMSFLSGLFVLGIGANLLISRYQSSGLTNPLQSIKKQFVGAGRPTISIQPIPAHADSHSHHGYLLQHAHGHDHPHTHDHDHSHAHGADHSHLPPGADNAPVTWRSLLFLGISGGLLPCPSALVVLLGAIALNRIGLGLILVLAFSLGLAGALTAIGLLFIYAGRAFEKIPARGKLLRALPVFSALFVLLIGLAISVRALQEVGVIN
ncbi:MAG: sulfite exporter TauE/SafE family protein [Chloroflexota bacterium]